MKNHQKEYSEKDRQVKSHARNDKQHFTENLATKAEGATRKKEIKNLYNIKNWLRGYTGTNQLVSVNTADGTILTSMQDIIVRVGEHFQNILNCSNPT